MSISFNPPLLPLRDRNHCSPHFSDKKTEFYVTTNWDCISFSDLHL